VDFIKDGKEGCRITASRIPLPKDTSTAAESRNFKLEFTLAWNRDLEGSSGIGE